MQTQPTQLDRVLERINIDGYVTNFWAIENYILRLGAIIHTLRHKRGMQLVSAMGHELRVADGERKNCYYLTLEKWKEMKKPETKLNSLETGESVVYGADAS